MSNTIAFFDFDKTLYKKDSLLEFTKFYKGKYVFYIGIINILPTLILLKLQIITNEKAKKKFISYFFKNEDYELFKIKGRLFALNKISNDLNESILRKLTKHIKNNHSVYIVTASFSEWIEPWCKELNIKIIATKLEVINSKITGNFSSINCNGKEKVNRIMKEINLNDFKEIYVYGSGKGDLDMLTLRTQKYKK